MLILPFEPSHFLQNCDRFTVKHALQNTQNDCHQWLSDSSKLHQIRFRPGLRTGPRWRSLQRSPRPLTGLRGPTSKRGEGGKEGKGNRRGGEKKGEGVRQWAVQPSKRYDASAAWGFFLIIARSSHKKLLGFKNRIEMFWSSEVA